MRTFWRRLRDAQLEGQASGFAATAFNAPGAGLVSDALQPQLAGFASASAHRNANYRIFGDQISLIGQPMGETITLKEPAYTTFSVAPSEPGSLSGATKLAPTFRFLHAINTIIAQLATKAPAVSRVGEPDYAEWIRNLTPLAKCRE